MTCRFLIGLFIIFSFLFVSCEADIDLQNVSNEISLHPSLVVPLGEANINLSDILSNYNADGKFVTIDKEIYFQDFDTSEFKLNNIDLSKNFGELNHTIIPSPLSPVILPPYTAFPTITNTDKLELGLNLNSNSQRIDSVRVGSATFGIQIDVSSDLVNIKPSDLTCTITIPNGQIRNLNGTPAVITFTPVRFGQTCNVVLSNFLIDLSGSKTGTPVQTSINLKTGSSSQQIKTSSNITFKLNIIQLHYDVAFGFFGNELTTTQINVQKIDIERYLPNSLMRFTNPSVDITAFSNLGANLRFQVDYIKAYVISDQTFNPVFASFNGSQSTDVVFNSKPDMPGNWVSKKMQTFDKDWGGTDKLFDNKEKPDIMEYKFSMFVDSVIDKNKPDFITPDAKIKVCTQTTIPLQVNSGSFYELKDSFDNVLVPITGALDRLPVTNNDSTFLVLSILNGLPIKTSFSLTLVDSLGIELQTNFQKKYTINAGKVDADGSVLPKQETQTLIISLAKEQLATIKKAKKIAYTVRIEGGDIDSKIHFTTSNTFDIKVGLYMMGNLNANLPGNSKK